MNMKYEIKPLTEKEETFIEEKINVYADSMAPSEPHTEKEQLVFKVEDEDKNVIGGCIVNIHAWGRAVLAQLWVDGQYRHHGLGSMLIRTAENAAREKNCYSDSMCLPLTRTSLWGMLAGLYRNDWTKIYQTTSRQTTPLQNIIRSRPAPKRTPGSSTRDSVSFVRR